MEISQNFVAFSEYMNFKELGNQKNPQYFASKLNMTLMVEWKNFGRRYLHLYYFYISNNEFKYKK